MGERTLARPDSVQRVHGIDMCACRVGQSTVALPPSMAP